MCWGRCVWSVQANVSQAGEAQQSLENGRFQRSLCRLELALCAFPGGCLTAEAGNLSLANGELCICPSSAHLLADNRYNPVKNGRPIGLKHARVEAVPSHGQTCRHESTPLVGHTDMPYRKLQSFRYRTPHAKRKSLYIIES